MSGKPKPRRLMMPTLAEDRRITAAAMADPDCPPLTDEQLGQLVPLKTLLGRPRSPNRKLLVSVRYSPEVVSYFRSTGAGWQSRMDGVLRQYVARQTRNAR
jgi:uncharacterized protein (DUF4415 family)